MPPVGSVEMGRLTMKRHLEKRAHQMKLTTTSNRTEPLLSSESHHGLFVFLTFSVVDGRTVEPVDDCDRGKKRPVPKEILVVIDMGQSVFRNGTETPNFNMKHKLAVTT